MKLLTFTVKDEEGGARLDKLVAQHAGVSRKVARIWISGGRVQVNQRTVRILTRPIRGGATVQVSADAPAPAPVRTEPARQGSDVEILRFDPWMVAVAKPAGLLSEHDRFGSPSIESVVPRLLAARGERKTRLWLVHRLDAGTSGVLVLARTPMAAAALGEAFRTGGARKRYLALCQGAVRRRHSVDAPIARAQGVRHAVSPAGKAALTHIEPLATHAGCSLVAALPETGRTHQIRVHLAHLGHPILGDRLYGGPGYTDDTPPEAIPRPMLHAERLVLPHPKTGEPLELAAAPPPDFAELAARLGLPPP